METTLQRLIKQIDDLIRDEQTNGGDWVIPFQNVKHKAELLLKDEKIEHQDTWDAAIKAHDNRAYVHVRSWSDFDDYFEERFNKHS